MQKTATQSGIETARAKNVKTNKIDTLPLLLVNIEANPKLAIAQAP